MGDPAADRRAASIRAGCLFLLLVFALAIVRSVVSLHGRQTIPLLAGAMTMLVAVALNYLGNGTWAARLTTFGVLGASAFLVTGAHDGFRSIAMLAFPAALVIAVMLFNEGEYAVLALATLATVTALGIAEIHHLIPSVPIERTPTDFFTVLFTDLIILAAAVFGGLFSRDARRNLARLRAAIDQLGRSEARYRSFIELAADAIFVVARDGTILEVNRQASVLTGLRREQLLSAPVATILSSPIASARQIGRPDGTVAEVEFLSA